MIKFSKGIMLCAIAMSCLFILQRETEIIEVTRSGFAMIGFLLFYKFLMDFWGNE